MVGQPLSEWSASSGNGIGRSAPPANQPPEPRPWQGNVHMEPLGMVWPRVWTDSGADRIHTRMELTVAREMARERSAVGGRCKLWHKARCPSSILRLPIDGEGSSLSEPKRRKGRQHTGRPSFSAVRAHQSRVPTGDSVWSVRRRLVNTPQ
jgi:hypothetical protein